MEREATSDPCHTRVNLLHDKAAAEKAGGLRKEWDQGHDLERPLRVMAPAPL